ncbi:MAG TPA: hypothetical protein VGD73_10080 [Pseudonocardia sp.]|jgi:hypothetical protein|uniref:hypothetical protein n=1 Tax=Pseudonocardia sp. TaxID=60912 RepID=UPI002EDA95F8
MISSGFTALAFAAVLFAIGLWGRRNADKLVLSGISPRAQRAKKRSIRRGAIGCQLGATVFSGLAVMEFVIWFTRG